MTQTRKPREVTYWMIEYTSIDGGRFDLRAPGLNFVQEFRTEAAARRYAKTMPDWQEPVVKQMWTLR